MASCSLCVSLITTTLVQPEGITGGSNSSHDTKALLAGPRYKKCLGGSNLFIPVKLFFAALRRMETVNDMPPELIYEVFLCLDVDSLLLARAVCTKWSEISRSKALWKGLYLSWFGAAKKSEELISWYKISFSSYLWQGRSYPFEFPYNCKHGTKGKAHELAR